MSRPTLRIAAVLLVAGTALSSLAIADTGALPSGTIIFPKVLPLIHENGSADLAVPSTPTVQAQYFNLAHCICSQEGLGSQQTFAEQVGLTGYVGPTATIPLQAWLGTECEVGAANDVERVANCSTFDPDIPNYSTLQITPANVEMSLFKFMNPDPATAATSCSQGSATDTFWLEASVAMNQENDFSVSTTVATDTLPPPVPTDFTAEGAESAIEVSWTPPVTADIYYYQGFCSDPEGNPPTSPGAQPRYQVSDTICQDGNGITLTPVSVMVSGGTDAGVDAGTVDTDAGTTDAGANAGIPTGLAKLDPAYLCGEGTATATSMRLTGLTNGVPYNVAVIVTDIAGNPAGVYFTSTMTPEPVINFWQDLHNRGSHVEGGFCLLAETYGDDSFLTNALRGFRDDNLGSTGFGRWLTDVYYATLARLGPYVHGSLALRIISGVLLAPLVVIALAWHFLTLPGLLALIVFAWGLRRRRRILRARRGGGDAADHALARATRWAWLRSRFAIRAATISTLGVISLVAARAHAGGATPYWDDDAANAQATENADDTSTATDAGAVTWHVGLRMGPYTPQIDSQLGGSVTPGPYKEMFGNYALMPMVDIDRFLWRGSGLLGVGISLGFMSKTAHPFTITSLPTDPDRARSPGDENSFRMIPFSVTAIYRATQLDDLYGIPVVPYVRAGLAYYAWWVTAPNGNFATVPEMNGQPCTPTDPNTSSAPCSLNHADGASLGVVGSIGLSIRAERIDAAAAQSMHESGLLHAGFYAEFSVSKVDGFGSDTKLSVGDTTWFAGVDFDF